MHDIFSRDPDPLEGILRPPSPPDNEMLRQALYTQTLRVLHRRRRVRQFAYAAALLVSFVAGAGVMRMTISGDTPLEREWIAFDSEDHRAEHYREAGERYMTEENDLQSALRCFSNSLDNGTEQDLTISSDDNWLLMAIKDARQKENNHAKQGG